MNLSIPFNKVIPFKESIAEIVSISLEKDISINDKELLGDFLVSGEYKNLDINVDTKPFEHVIPFSVDLDEDIILDTLNYEIEDFSYNIENSDTLSINIILHITADKKEIINVEDVLEKEREIFKETNEEIPLKEESTIIENNIKENNETSIISTTNLKEDYITYHIHIVKVNETLDSISSEYKIEKDKLIELNDITNIEVGDKIIIPDLDE